MDHKPLILNVRATKLTKQVTADVKPTDAGAA